MNPIDVCESPTLNKMKSIPLIIPLMYLRIIDLIDYKRSEGDQKISQIFLMVLISI